MYLNLDNILLWFTYKSNKIILIQIPNSFIKWNEEVFDYGWRMTSPLVNFDTYQQNVQSSCPPRFQTLVAPMRGTSLQQQTTNPNNIFGIHKTLQHRTVNYPVDVKFSNSEMFVLGTPSVHVFISQEKIHTTWLPQAMECKLRVQYNVLLFGSKCSL